MGRARETKNGRVWWKTQRKAWKRIPQKDEERSKCSRVTWRLQIELHKEVEGRTTRGRTHQKTSWRRARAWKT